MSEQLENNQVTPEVFDGQVNAARARKKGAILFGALDKQAGLTSTGVAELEALEAAEQGAQAEAGIQDPLSHLSDEQKAEYSNQMYALQDAASRNAWDEARVDAVKANINAKYGVK